MKICEAVIIPAPIKARSLNALAKDAYSVSDRIRTPSGPRRSAHQIRYQPALSLLTKYLQIQNLLEPNQAGSTVVWFCGFGLVGEEFGRTCYF